MEVGFTCLGLVETFISVVLEMEAAKMQHVRSLSGWFGQVSAMRMSFLIPSVDH